MPTPKHYEQQMNLYFFATIGMALGLPLICIAPIVMMKGDVGLCIAIGGVIVGFAGMFACAAAGSRSSKQLGQLPIRDRFWHSEYEGSFTEEEFLAAPLNGYFSKRIKLQDIAGRVLADIPRYTQKPMGSVAFEVNNRPYEIRRRFSETRCEIDIRPANASEPLLHMESINRQTTSYEINVGDEMTIEVIPEPGTMFPKRLNLFVDGERVGLVHAQEGIIFKGLVLFVPIAWPQDLRLLLATFFWAARGR